MENKAWSWNQPKVWLVFVIVLGFIALGVLSLLRERLVYHDMNQMSVSADGEVFAKPDIAQIVVGVRTDTQRTAAAAVQQNTEQMNKVHEVLGDLGIDDKDIQTTQYQLNPVYHYPTNGQRTLAGYDLYQQATVKIRDLDNIGEVIEQTTSAGANQVGSINFTIDDQESLQAKARANAISKAQTKAEELEKMTGIKLGKLVNIYESNNNQPVPTYAYGMGGASADAMAKSAPEIASGELKVTTNITLVYKVE
ncbi:MAG: SIMPL domain-containing protein [Candidatus Komeilibacteria bacterium]